MDNHRSNHSITRLILFVTGIFWPFLSASSQEYFQQEVNHKIRVTLVDSIHELNGFESVEYINNSPDTLRFLYFHLWPNAYSNNKTALAREIFARDGKGKLFDDKELMGFIDSLDFKVDSHSVQWHLLPESPDICKIILNEPLTQGNTILITTPFHVKIPKGVTSRLGHIGESYQITQWYPKPAVYDRNGWHQMPYLDQGEFYSEFGSYDVSITLPANYVVGATGNLQNDEEKEWLDMLSADSPMMGIPGTAGGGFPLSSSRQKTLRFTEEHIHDFAWFADKRFHVLKGSVTLPESGREVITWAMFTDQEAQFWISAIPYLNNAISRFSEWLGDYPYDNFTAVQSALNAGAGMEYPGLTVIGLAKDPWRLEEVIIHEICHSWFYSAVGSDERTFPFMDESITSAYESRYMEERYPEKKLWEVVFGNRKLARLFHLTGLPVRLMQEIEWLVPARLNLEQPVNLAADDYNYENYSSIIYNKAAIGFNWLRVYLGDSLFDSVMTDYYRIWKNKHPGPEDLRDVFESRSDKDLSWFFDDFLGTTKRLDYKIVGLENNKLLIKNNGELDAPLLIAGLSGDSVVSVQWEDGFAGKKWINVPPGKYSEIRIDPDHKMTELFRLNNNIRKSGICRKSDPVQFRFLYTVDDPDSRQLIYIPVVDWNSTDGFMAGMAIHNGTLIPKRFKYLVIPFYSFRNQRLTGFGKVSFNVTPFDSFIRMATFSAEAEQFGAPGDQIYHKVRAGSDIGFRSGKTANHISHSIFGYYIAASDLSVAEPDGETEMRSYLQAGYSVERKSTVNPFKMLLLLESGRSYQKASLEFNYRLSYNGKNNGLDSRFFAGTVLNNGNADPVYGFAAGGRSGREQYLYQGVFPDRFGTFPETFWSRQMTLSEGGLISPVNDSLGYSRRIFSITLASSLPGKASLIPVKPFVNLLLNDHDSGTPAKSLLFCEAGLKAGIWDLFEIYFPLIVSDNIEEITGSFRNRIRFVFRLDALISTF